jgi:spore germination protein GerM
MARENETRRDAMRRFVVIAGILALMLATAACGGGDEATPAGEVPTVDLPSTETEPPAPPAETAPPAESEPPTETEPPPPAETEPAETFAFEVWFARDAGTRTGEGGEQTPLGPLLFSTPRTEEETPRVAQAALEALLAGPSSVEATAGVSTAIPEGTRLLGVTIEDGIATVDLSAEYESGGGSLAMFMRLAQVVYTVTQFPTVEGVLFELDGQPVEVFSGEGIVLDGPVTREDYEDMLPAITVATPGIGAEIQSPVRIAGTANVFEANVTVRILDAAGNVLVEDFTTATCGTGCRGDYETELAFDVSEEQEGVIQLHADDAAGTGTMPGLVEIPVTLRAG